jgi:hypothetical protein
LFSNLRQKRLLVQLTQNLDLMIGDKELVRQNIDDEIFVHPSIIMQDVMDQNFLI